jgi:hypothetical protein
MERTLNEEFKQQFIKESNDLISRNLVPRKFAFFQTKQEYLGEVHKQIDLLIQSDTLHRNKLASKLQNKLIENTMESSDDDKMYEVNSSTNSSLFNQSIGSSTSLRSLTKENNQNLLEDQINELDTDSCTTDSLSSNSNSLNEKLKYSDELFDSASSLDCESGTQSSDNKNEDNKKLLEDAKCFKCNLLIKNNKLNELIDTLESDDENLMKTLLFKNESRNCECNEFSIDLDDEAKCMNLLVDQIIDLAECKEDYMELDE